ncbi:signal peptidase I [Glycomyces sp. NRRL B-16210]|uniref:signal peptidase I n=1 Tax=Glycomyces sp. NRRL B-16210 TaxID=1463821 RepID=UPI00068D08DF|nr:signal peptidase I [Glycomyces sp. NRRL B-16210]
MADASAKRRRRFDELPWSTVVRVAVCVGLLSIGAFLAVAALAPRLLGWNGTTVVSGSMEPKISVGDIALTSPIDPDELVAGQVISFEDPAGFSKEPILHRIVEVNDDGTFTTKGDANADADSTPVPPENVIGIGRILTPGIGKPVVWLHDGDLFAFGLFAAVSAVLIRGAVPLPIGLGRPGTRMRRAAEIATATIVILVGGYLVFLRGTGSGNADFTAGTDTGSTWAAGTWEEPAAACRVRWSLGGPTQAGGTITVYNDSDTRAEPLWELRWTFTEDQVASLSPNGGTISQDGRSVVYNAADWMGPINAAGSNVIQTVTVKSVGGFAADTPADFALNGTPCAII